MIKEKKVNILFGFGAFLNVKSNITEKILSELHFKNIKKIILPVEYSREKIISMLFNNKNKPDYIIGLGQHYTGKLLRIERKSENIFWEKIEINNEKYLSTGMIQEKPDNYIVNLKLPKKKFSWISYDAGFYVCNYAMYLIMDYIKKNNLQTKFAFIHIPSNYPINKAKRELKEYLNELK